MIKPLVAFFTVLPVILIAGKPFNLYQNQTCGYASCPKIDTNKLNVHLIAHSHDDLGWLRTVDKYFYLEVQYVISSVIAALKQDPARRFIQVETYYFYEWWKMQEEPVKQDVRDLINEGRFEIINGGWCMNDEANTHYQSTIDQLTLGHRYMEDTLGKCARSKIGWSIDPFGHSREQASIYSQMDFDGFLVGRIDFRDDNRRKKDKTTDLMWTGSSNLGSSSNIFTSIVYRAYNNPPNFCFDIHCSDPKMVTDNESPEYNWESRVNEFTDYIKGQAKAYPTNNILITMGDDVQYQGAATNYANIDKLIAGFKKFNPTVEGKEINIFYSTPSCYVKAVHDFVVDYNLELEIKEDDFFPYATTANGLWVGYYTSRPTSKRYERISNNILQIAKQITSLAGFPRGSNFYLENAVAIMQHHDAITGTQKQEVEKDYHRLLAFGIEASIKNTSAALQKLLDLSEDPSLRSCPLANSSICSLSKQDKFNVLLYNPLAKQVAHYPQIPVDDGKWKVTDSEGNEIVHQLSDPVRDFSFIAKDLGVQLNDEYLIFKANLPAMGFKVYTVEKIGEKERSSKSASSNTAGFKNNFITLDDHGFLSSITINNKTQNVKQEIMFYRSSYGSGTYMFSPDSKFPNAISFTNNITNRITKGEVLVEVRQEFSNWATQVIRIYDGEDHVEFDWAVGPIDVGDGYGRDVIVRFSTDLDTNSIFYTDANSRELLKRQKNYRPTYNYTNESPIPANYYPITSRIVLKDEAKNKEFAVITDRPQGATSLENGQLEIMVHRGLLRDETRSIRAIDEHLYEIEYGTGLIPRGSFFVTFGSSTRTDEEPASSVTQRKLVQRKHLQPWMFFTNQSINTGTTSFLATKLPEVVHVLSFEKWNNDDNTYLLRLEHLLEKDDDEVLSKEVSVDLSAIFTTFTITSAKEMTLNGMSSVDDSSRLEWPQVPARSKSDRSDNDLTITLAPMQIRTFIVNIK